jgi:photosystem II stability/assembly factor-like uncharacterized protein
MSEIKQEPVSRSGWRVVLFCTVAILIVIGCKQEDKPTEPQITTQNGWVSQQSGTIEQLYSAHFVDANTGTVVGDEGTILRTTDGGAIWTPQVCPFPEYRPLLTGVAFTDENHGTITERDILRILHTTDGGDSWFVQSTGLDPLTYPQLLGVAFAEARTGMAVGRTPFFRSILLRSTNGGADWTALNTKTIPAGAIIAVTFATPQVGYAVGEEGVILRSDDVGGSWAMQNSGITETIHDVSFADANIGIALASGREMVGDTAEHQYRKWSIILRTTNGGGVWTTLQTMQEVLLTAVCVTDADNGTVVGSEGTILRTTDGGATWVQQISGTTEDLNDVFFTDRNTGTAIGDNGVILRTTNGGFSK